MSAVLPISGYLPQEHALVPQQHYADLPGLGRWLAAYPEQDLWELDSQRLPRSLRLARQRFKHFAQTQLRPLAQRLDQALHAPAGEMLPQAQELLARAGRAGLLSEVLPRPWGSAHWAEYRHALAWKYCLMTEEYAAVDGGLMLLLGANYLGLMPILIGGNLRQIRRVVLPAFKANQNGNPQIFAFAITEPGAGSDVEEGHGAQSYRPRVIAQRRAGGWCLSGRKVFISGGDIAEYVVVFAALENEGMESWTAFLVRRGSPGFRVARTELKMGMRASGAAELEFEQVSVADDDVIGELRGGWTLNRATLNLSRFPVAAMGIGFARGACEAALSYCCQKKLGGRRLIDYQEVQLQLADMLAVTRSIRAAMWHTVSHNRRPRQLEAALCKFHFTDQAQRVCEQALELLSNDAGDAAYWIEKALRDVRLTRIFEGTNQINRLALIEDWQPHLLQQVQQQRSCGV